MKLREFIRNTSNENSSHFNSGLISPAEFIDQYPYLLRYCQENQFQGDSIILNPQPGELASFGVFFYPLINSSIPDITYHDRKLLVIESRRLVSKVEAARDAFGKGVLVASGDHFNKLSNEEAGIDNRGMGGLLEAASNLYKKWPILDIGKAHPILTVPARMEIPRSLSIVK